MPERVKIPPPPTYDGDDQLLRDEQQVARVEILMTKGVRDRRQLMVLLEVDDPRQMDRYMRRVFARWELQGTTRDFSRHRGEGLFRLDLIESELWASISNADAPQIKMVALKNLIDVQKQRSEMLGLTPKVIEALGDASGESNIAFTKRLATHEKLSLVASRMLALIEERTGEVAQAARQAVPDRGEVEDLVIEGSATSVSDAPGESDAPA